MAPVPAADARPRLTSPAVSPWDVVLGVVALVGQAAEQVGLVADERETVSEPRARRRTVARRTGADPLPLPAARLAGGRADASLLRPAGRPARPETGRLMASASAPLNPPFLL